MKRPLRTVAAWFSILTVLAPIRMVEAGPFRDFFHAVRNAIGHPSETPRPHRSRHRSSQKHNESPPSDASTNLASSSPVPAPPGKADVRVAKAALGATEQKTDLLYGIPVPGKPGIVTSPFAPDRGYVDVTGFAPGTEVQDPYTGKIFLTP